MVEKGASQVGPTRANSLDLLEVLADGCQSGPQLPPPAEL